MKKWYIRFHTSYKFFDVYVEDNNCKSVEDVVGKYIFGQSNTYLKFNDTNDNSIYINLSTITAFEILPYAFPCIAR